MKNLQNEFIRNLEECVQKSKQFRSIKEVFDAFIKLNVLLCLNANNTAIYKCYLNYDLCKHNKIKALNLTNTEFLLLLEASKSFYHMIKKSEAFDDVLGDIYDIYLGETLGQFLTPKDLSQQIMELIYINEVEIKNPFNLGDTTGCGAGALILAQLKAIFKKHGIFALSKANIIGMDISEHMVQLTMIQILANIQIHRIPVMSLTMYWGDTLTEYGKPDNVFFTMKINEEFMKIYNEFSRFETISREFK